MRFLKRMYKLKMKKKKIDNEKRNYFDNNIDPDIIHRKIIENKPDYMTDYEYRLYLVQQRKEQLQNEHLKK